jgi:hypothetical protein
MTHEPIRRFANGKLFLVIQMANFKRDAAIFVIFDDLTLDKTGTQN